MWYVGSDNAQDARFNRTDYQHQGAIMSELPRHNFRPQFTPQLSFGNMLTIVVAVVSVGIAWGDSKRSLGVVQALAYENAERIRVNELAVTRQDERTNSILTGLARIEGQLSVIDKRLDARRNN